MFRSTLSKVMWVGRATVFMVGLAVIGALVVGVASAAFGANGTAWLLGRNNSATSTTQLGGASGANGAMVDITNNNAGTDDTALSLNVQSGEPPLTVKSGAGKATNLNADELDGKDSSTFVAYKRTVVVSPVGSDTEDGQALLDAISSITDASASKPYLIHIEPGTYDLGNGSLSMKPFVDIEGSGELNTLITSDVSTGGCHPGTVDGADDAEMRFLTVQNTGMGLCQVAIYNGSASPRLTHVTAKATGVGGSVNDAVRNETLSSPTMTDLTATASGGSVANEAVVNSRSSPTITQSKLRAPQDETGASLALGGTFSEEDTTKVALTQLVGPIQKSNSATLECFNNYDENLNPVDSEDCQ
jgi:hypothetical protein